MGASQMLEEYDAEGQLLVLLIRPFEASRMQIRLKVYRVPIRRWIHDQVWSCNILVPLHELPEPPLVCALATRTLYPLQVPGPTPIGASWFRLAMYTVPNAIVVDPVSVVSIPHADIGWRHIRVIAQVHLTLPRLLHRVFVQLPLHLLLWLLLLLAFLLAHLLFNTIRKHLIVNYFYS